MKKMIVGVLVAFVLFTSTVCADEYRYVLPDWLHYNEAGQIVTNSGKVYDSIWDDDLMFVLSWDTRYGDREYMDKYMRADEFGNPIRMGDGSADILLLCGAAVVAVSGAVFARRKAKHAAA